MRCASPGPLGATCENTNPDHTGLHGGMDLAGDWQWWPR